MLSTSPSAGGLTTPGRTGAIAGLVDVRIPAAPTPARPSRARCRARRPMPVLAALVITATDTTLHPVPTDPWGRVADLLVDLADVLDELGDDPRASALRHHHDQLLRTWSAHTEHLATRKDTTTMSDATSEPGWTCTATSVRIARHAMRLGLNPRTRITPYRRVREIHLDQRDGPDSWFGTVEVSAVTGRVLRGTFAFGNDDTHFSFRTGPDMARFLLELADLYEHLAPIGRAA